MGETLMTAKESIVWREQLKKIEKLEKEIENHKLYKARILGMIAMLIGNFKCLVEEAINNNITKEK